MTAFSVLAHEGLLGADWDTVRGERHDGRHAGDMQTMLDPDDPGIPQLGGIPRPPPIKMTIGPWYLDEFGNPTREIRAAES